MHILLVEDDDKIAAFIRESLYQEGFTVSRVDNGLDGLRMAVEGSYHAAIVDIMLPELDGLSLIENLRRQGIMLPILIVSAKRSIDDRVQGLQKGSDDYLIKPFAVSELIARVQALIRRANVTSEPSTIAYEDLSINLLQRQVLRNGKKIDLQPREFSLLEFLMRNAEKPVSKTMILEHIWGYHFSPQTNTIDVLVWRLRNKIDKDFSNKLIHTIRGIGYVIKSSS